jgi:uncharacterized protein (TIGR02757 family)
MTTRVHTLKRAQLKERLDVLCERLDVTQALSVDPIRFVRGYTSPQDQEVVAFIASLLAYGRVSAIGHAIEEVLERVEGSPYACLISDEPERAVARFEGFVYRFTRGEDLTALWLGLGALCREHGSVGEALKGWDDPQAPDLHPALCDLYDTLKRGVEERVEQSGLSEVMKDRCRGGRGFAHLWSNPHKGSALKRVNMLTRWLVRGPGPVDLGLWSELGAHRLTIPLDAHVFRTARALGLTTRASPSWRAAREVTEALKLLCPSDPVRYDFALAHLGISGGCVGHRDDRHCPSCPLDGLCTLT